MRQKLPSSSDPFCYRFFFFLKEGKKLLNNFQNQHHFDRIWISDLVRFACCINCRVGPVGTERHFSGTGSDQEAPFFPKNKPNTSRKSHHSNSMAKVTRQATAEIPRRKAERR
jgi:hypothetical protein